jgi:hypothetical protein
VQNLILGLKVFVVAALASFGAGMITHNARHPDGFGIMISVFPCVVALLLWQVWFWRRD